MLRLGLRTRIHGILSGNSDGHGVRALLAIISVNDELRLVALGRRVDEGRSQTFAATEDFRTLLPLGEWVHLAASFPQYTLERNPCNCKLDSLMFIDRAVTQLEIDQQYRRMVSAER